MVINWTWHPTDHCRVATDDRSFIVARVTPAHKWFVFDRNDRTVCSGNATCGDEAREIVLSILEIRLAYRS